MYVVALLHFVHGSSSEKRPEDEVVFSQHPMAPILTDNRHRIVALPDTRYRDIEDEDKDHAERIIRDGLHVMWEDHVTVEAPESERAWVKDAFHDEKILRRLKRIVEEELGNYKKFSRKDGGMTLAELFEEIGKRMFGENGLLREAGRALVKRASERIEEAGHKGERSRMGILEKIKKCGEDLCSSSTLGEQLIRRRNILCEVFLHLCSSRGSMIGAIAERVLIKAGKGGGQIRDFVATGISSTELMNIYDTEGIEVATELTNQALLGTPWKEVIKEPLVQIIREIVSERRKREEEEKKREEEKERKEREVKRKEEEKRAEKAMQDLLGEDTELNRGKGKSVKKKMKKGKDIKREKKETIKPDAVEALEEPKSEIAGPSKIAERTTPGDSEAVKEMKKYVRSYRIHSRVALWGVKDIKEIMRRLKERGEPKWQNRSPKEIAEQKETHDIGPVVRLLKSKARDKFFIEIEKNVSYKAAAMLWRQGSDKGEMGLVETTIGVDENGQNVVYHLMFKPILGEDITVEMREGIESILSKDTCLSEELEGLEGFVRQGKKKPMVRYRDDLFEVVWEDPQDISKVLRRLVVFRRPQRVKVSGQGVRKKMQGL